MPAKLRAHVRVREHARVHVYVRASMCAWCAFEETGRCNTVQPRHQPHTLVLQFMRQKVPQRVSRVSHRFGDVELCMIENQPTLTDKR